MLGRLGAPDISDDDVEALQTLLIDCGASAEIEAAIEGLVARSLTALDDAPLTAEARRALQDLATYVAWRDR